VLGFAKAGKVIRDYLDKRPRIHYTAWIADNADVIGDVEIGEDASVWFQTVIRGDVSYVCIGARTNIQDQCTIHVTRDACPTIIHEDVTLGHKAIVHGAEVKSGALIGIGAVVLDKAVIGEGALVGAMALVTPGTVVPAGKLVMGQPARVVRDVSEAEHKWMRETLASYASLAKDYSRKTP
jgi:carbonic anhydrase/acetyltransferase-like protein (isoleucine patch superfamily)